MQSVWDALNYQSVFCAFHMLLGAKATFFEMKGIFGVSKTEHEESNAYEHTSMDCHFQTV